MRKFITIGAVVSSALTFPVLAQTTQVMPETQSAIVLVPPQMNKLQQGTEISLRLLKELTTKNKALKAGSVMIGEPVMAKYVVQSINC